LTAVRWVEIGANEDGQRLDNFLLRELKGVPRSRIYRLLRKGEVRVNKKRCKPSDRLVEGDQVRIPPVRMSESSTPVGPSKSLRELLSASILFEDEAVLVINKPSGLAVHGGSGVSAGVIENLRAMRPSEKYLELVHRLDRDTSGCLILARSRPALVQLHESLRQGRVDKYYLALTQGKWPNAVKQVDAPLKKNELSSGERIVRVQQDGKASRTYFEVVQRFSGATLVKAKLDTGRTHQIRVHTQLTGHPILGDDKYGDEEGNARLRKVGLKRLFLHAATVSFIHPISGERITLESPLPSDLNDLLDGLER